LTHARTVESNSLKADKTTEDAEHFSVVVGNRLPRQGTDCVVHLVSLENLAETHYLPTVDAQGNYQAGSFPEDIAYIRLVSLLRWSFTAGINPSLADVSSSSLRIPTGGLSTAEKEVTVPLSLGYSAFNHLTRLGDETASWYRGPFIPVDVSTAPPPTSLPAPITSSDAALRYHPDTGMLDVSYAAAWQLGRLLGVQNKSFATALYNWKRNNAAKTVLAFEQEVLRNKFGNTLTMGTEVNTQTLYKAKAALVAKHLQPHLSAEAKSCTSKDNLVLKPPKKSGFIQRKQHRQALHQLRTDPQRLAAIHQDTAVPEPILDWLQALRQLKGVPFYYLVPSEQFLPPESIRFFQLDHQWINALVAGAFSIGSATAGDRAHDHATYDKLSHWPADEIVSGFLLRSTFVKASPNLGVIAYDEAGQKMPDVVQFTRLSPTIFLFMVKGKGALDHVDIHQHPEGLHFGINEDGTKSLRYLTVPTDAPAGKQAGDQIENGSTIAISFREGEKRVLLISHLASQINEALQAANANTRAFTSAEFALEMIEGVQAVRFCVEGSTTCNQST
ncbi:MAG: hypothetical protein AAF840_14655, partial [Bacteroidota bacterium]